jgi:hypothetical protein
MAAISDEVIRLHAFHRATPGSCPDPRYQQFAAWLRAHIQPSFDTSVRTAGVRGPDPAGRAGYPQVQGAWGQRPRPVRPAACWCSANFWLAVARSYYPATRTTDLPAAGAACPAIIWGTWSKL